MFVSNANICKGSVSKVLANTKQQIIFSTYNLGIGIIAADTVYTINKSNGLLSNACNSLYSANDSIIWIATAKGINKLTYHILPNKTLQYNIETLAISSALQNVAINEVMQQHDTLFIAANNGAYIQLLNQPSLKKYQPKLIIENVTITIAFIINKTLVLPIIKTIYASILWALLFRHRAILFIDINCYPLIPIGNTPPTLL